MLLFSLLFYNVKVRLDLKIKLSNNQYQLWKSILKLKILKSDNKLFFILNLYLMNLW